jgi:hypothetical protein
MSDVIGDLQEPYGATCGVINRSPREAQFGECSDIITSFYVVFKISRIFGFPGMIVFFRSDNIYYSSTVG